MPLTEKGEKIKKAMQEQYGKEKGEQVLYASKNKGTITGIDQIASAAPIPTVSQPRSQPTTVTQPSAAPPPTHRRSIDRKPARDKEVTIRGDFDSATIKRDSKGQFTAGEGQAGRTHVAKAMRQATQQATGWKGQDHWKAHDQRKTPVPISKKPPNPSFEAPNAPKKTLSGSDQTIHERREHGMAQGHPGGDQPPGHRPIPTTKGRDAAGHAPSRDQISHFGGKKAPQFDHGVDAGTSEGAKKAARTRAAGGVASGLPVHRGSAAQRSAQRAAGIKQAPDPARSAMKKRFAFLAKHAGGDAVIQPAKASPKPVKDQAITAGSAANEIIKPYGNSPDTVPPTKSGEPIRKTLKSGAADLKAKPGPKKVEGIGGGGTPIQHDAAGISGGSHRSQPQTPARPAHDNVWRGKVV